MTHFILFVYITTFSMEGGVTTTTAEFKTEEACERARYKVVDEFHSFGVREPKAFCIGNK